MNPKKLDKKEEDYIMFEDDESPVDWTGNNNKEDDYIGKCTYCGIEDVEICPDTGWCDQCQANYAKEQEENELP
jgi:hypothetical protein